MKKKGITVYENLKNKRGQYKEARVKFCGGGATPSVAPVANGSSEEPTKEAWTPNHDLRLLYTVYTAEGSPDMEKLLCDMSSQSHQSIDDGTATLSP